MENNNVNTNNSKDDFEVRRLKLELEKLELDISNSKKFNKKDFLIYVLPSLLQIFTVLLGAYILLVNNFWDIKTELFEIKNEKLSLENEKLNLRKTDLHDSINVFISKSNTLNILLKQKQNNFDSLNNQFNRLIYVGDNLKQLISTKNKEINKLSNFQYEKTIDNYLKGYYEISTFEVANLIDTAKTDENFKKTILVLIDKKLNQPMIENYDTNIFKIKINFLKYLITNQNSDKISFRFSLKSYFEKIKFYNGEYNENLLNTLIFKDWTNDEIDENLTLLWNYRMSSNNDFYKLSQVCLWATYPLMTKNYMQTTKIEYLPNLYKTIHNETKFLLDSSDVILKTPDIYQTKRYIKAMFAACPQCYFATEITVLRNNLKNFNKLSKSRNFSLSFTIDTIEEQSVAKVSGYKSIVKFKLLLDNYDFQSDHRIFEVIVSKFTNMYDYPNIRIISTDKDLLVFQEKIEAFYQKNKAAVSYWSSNERISDFSKPEFRKKIIKGDF